MIWRITLHTPPQLLPAPRTYGNALEVNSTWSFTTGGPTTFINAVTGLKTNWSEEIVYNHSLVYPTALTLDGNGNLLILCRAKKEVLKLTPQGQFSTYADLSSLSPYGIHSIAYQPGLGRLLIVTGTTALYTFSNGQLTILQLYGVNPSALAVKSTDDSFYAGSMTQGDSIVHYDSNGNVISTIVTNTQGCFQLALDEANNKLYYTETFAGQVVEVDLSDNSTSVIATGVGIPGTFDPIAVALDEENNLYYFTTDLFKYEGGSWIKIMDSIAGGGQLIWSPAHSAFLVANGAGASIISYNPVTAEAEHLTQYVNASSIVEMDDGTVLIADGRYFGKFIQKVDSSGFAPFTQEMQGYCFALERDSNGNIYAGLDDGSIWRVGADGSATVWAAGYSTDPVVSLHYDSKNNAMISFTGNENASTATIWRIPLFAPSTATKIVELSDVKVHSSSPAGAVDDSGNIYILERKANVIYKIVDGSNALTTFASSVLDNEAITVPCMEYLSKEDALLVSTIQNYELWPLDNPVKSTFATNNGAVDNFAINETKDGNLIAIHSGQVFRLEAQQYGYGYTFPHAVNDVNWITGITAVNTNSEKSADVKVEAINGDVTVEEYTLNPNVSLTGNLDELIRTPFLWIKV